MTSHNPAGYYGLKLSELVEIEITQLDYFSLASLINDLTYSLTPQGGDFATNEVSTHAAYAIAHLSPIHMIKLLRWLAEILEVKGNGQS
jgi:hypothetical protein